MNSVAELQAWVDAERENGLLEIAFTPGPEATKDEAAAVTLAMLKYEEDVLAERQEQFDAFMAGARGKALTLEFSVPSKGEGWDDLTQGAE